MVALSGLTKLSTTGPWDAICVVDKRVHRDLASHFEKLRADDEAFDKEVSWIHILYFTNKRILSFFRPEDFLL